MKVRFSALAMASLLMAGQAGAAMVKYNDEATFKGKLQSVNTEDLESFEAGESPAPSLGLKFGSGDAVATLSGPDTMRSVDEGDTQGRTSIGVGTKIFWEGGAEPFTIRFLSNIKAFGFWTSDVGDFALDCGTTCPGPQNAAPLTVSFLLGNDLVDTLDVQGSPGNGSTEFWGVVSELAFDTIVFSNSTLTGSPEISGGFTDGQGFDNFMYGTPTPTNETPEPSALALAGLALLGLAAGRRRRRRR